MRRLECARPPRTAMGNARNAGEAVQQLAHLSRERQRLVQERRTVMRRIRKIDGRLQAIVATEEKLMPLLQSDAKRAPNTAAPAPRRPAILPDGLGEVTLKY